MSERREVAAGDRFGEWTVIAEATTGQLRAMHCRCDCGVERTVRLANLGSGRSSSCGHAANQLRPFQSVRHSALTDALHSIVQGVPMQPTWWRV